MNSIRSIFAFTFGEQIRKKSFLIATIVMAVAMAAVAALPTIISNVQSGSTSSGSSEASAVLYIADPDGVLGSGAAQALQTAFSGYTVKTADADTLQTLEKQVQGGENANGDALAVVRADASASAGITFDYYVKASGKGPDADTLAETLHKLYSAALLQNAGVPDTAVTAVLGSLSYKLHTGDGSNGMQGFTAAMTVCVLLFITIFTYGVTVATSIASEKTSRVLEILITSTKPSRIIIGKSAAIGAAGLLQLCVALAAGYISSRLAGGNSGTGVLSFAGLTPGVAVLCVAYFLLGFALYAMLSAVAGSTVSNSEDVQSAVQPVTLLGMVSFYLAYFGFMAQGTPTSLAASLIPFSAPFSMPGRMMVSSVPVWQIALSLVILAAATVLCGLLSIRLYSAAVLHYGKRLKFSELFRLARADGSGGK